MSDPAAGDIWLEQTASGEVKLVRRSDKGEFWPTAQIPRKQIARVAETLLDLTAPDEQLAIAKRIVKREKKSRKRFRARQRESILFIYNKLRAEGADVTMVEIESK